MRGRREVLRRYFERVLDEQAKAAHAIALGVKEKEKSALQERLKRLQADNAVLVQKTADLTADVGPQVVRSLRPGVFQTS